MDQAAAQAEIPIPEELPCPLPAFLERRQVVILFRHWGLGDRRYVDKVVQNGLLKFHAKEGCASNRLGLASSLDVIGFYLRAQSRTNNST